MKMPAWLSALCTCDHRYDWHSPVTWKCEVDDCECVRFEEAEE